MVFNNGMTSKEAQAALLRRIEALLETHGLGGEFSDEQQDNVDIALSNVDEQGRTDQKEILVDGLGYMILLAVKVEFA